MKNIRKNLLGILILIVGVVVGVLLVRQTQNFKNRAMEKTDEFYTVCRKTGTDNGKWQEVRVRGEELSDYLNSGAILGKCPKELIK